MQSNHIKPCRKYIADQGSYNGTGTACASRYAVSMLELDIIRTHGSAAKVLGEEQLENGENVRFLEQDHNTCTAWLR